MTDPKGYSRLQIALHRLAALLIVHQYLFKDAISAARDAAVKGMESAFNPLVLAHLAGGALVLVFALWRPSIRAGRGAPETLGDSAVQRALAKATHLGLYAVMILMLISGSVAWFGGVQAAAQGHNVMEVALLALVALHVVGAIYHHFLLKHGLINRMRRAEG